MYVIITIYPSSSLKSYNKISTKLLVKYITTQPEHCYKCQTITRFKFSLQFFIELIYICIWRKIAHMHEWVRKTVENCNNRIESWDGKKVKSNEVVSFQFFSAIFLTSCDYFFFLSMNCIRLCWIFFFIHTWVRFLLSKRNGFIVTYTRFHGILMMMVIW